MPPGLFVYQSSGGELPKQYVNFIGERSMLEHTLVRAERLIPADHLITVVSHDHLRHSEVQRQLSDRPEGTVVVQSENKDTGPGLLLPLIHLDKSHPDSTVVVFPPDHFVLQEAVFMDRARQACEAVEQDPSRVILLGAEPDGYEQGYEYIVPAVGVRNLAQAEMHPVLSLGKRPFPDVIPDLMPTGCLWNTMVTVFKLPTMLDLTRRLAPILHSTFTQVRGAVGTAREWEAKQKAYWEVEPVNFSDVVLQGLVRKYPGCLLVLPVRGVLWSDWGSPRRIADTLAKVGCISRHAGALSRALQHV